MRQLKLLGLGLLAALVLTACGVQTPVLEDGLDTQAILNATIDFEDGLAPGDRPTSLSLGTGISGDAIAGTVALSGSNPDLESNSNADPTDETDEAMIFDAECVGAGCSGDDDDLSSPGQGNILIITEDGDSGDPDDADVSGEAFNFSFAGFGPTGLVDVHSIVVIDVEGSENESAEITAYGPTCPAGCTVVVPSLNDGETATVPLNFTDVAILSIALNGSGGIDDIVISIEVEEPGGGEGCTPGYWKQSQHFDSWVGYAPSDLFSSVFEDAFPGMTLLDVLKQGGGGLKALGRHTVAALLNGASGDVSYEFTATDVIAAFNAVHPAGDYEGQKNIFATQNEMGCPLN